MQKFNVTLLRQNTKNPTVWWAQGQSSDTNKTLLMQSTSISGRWYWRVVILNSTLLIPTWNPRSSSLCTERNKENSNVGTLLGGGITCSVHTRAQRRSPLPSKDPFCSAGCMVSSLVVVVMKRQWLCWTHWSAAVLWPLPGATASTSLERDSVGRNVVSDYHPQMVSKKGSRALGSFSGRRWLYFFCHTANPVTTSASGCPSGW